MQTNVLEIGQTGHSRFVSRRAMYQQNDRGDTEGNVSVNEDEAAAEHGFGLE